MHTPEDIGRAMIHDILEVSPNAVHSPDAFPYMDGRRSLLGDARFAKDLEFRDSSCMAGSSDRISPFAS